MKTDFRQPPERRRWQMKCHSFLRTNSFRLCDAGYYQILHPGCCWLARASTSKVYLKSFVHEQACVY